MKKSTYFITISIVFLTFLVVYYGGRMLYFRSLNKRLATVGEVTLAEVIKNKSYDTAIHKEDNKLYYRGNVLNNYVYYSNRYFRILGVEEDSILLVDDISTILPFEEEFGKSEIHTWLNETYLKTLSKQEEKLENVQTCIDKECTTSVESKIGLLSFKQYEKANHRGNYLNNGNYYWLSDGNYIDKEGNLIEHDEGLYGVRAVLKLKKDVVSYGGTGTYYDPYFIDLEDALTFANTETGTLQVGAYITYSDKLWRVIGIDNTLKVVLQDSIGKFPYSNNHNQFDMQDKTSIAYYLNHTFLDELDKTDMVEGPFSIGAFETSYLDQHKEQIQAYVGLQELGDLFLNDKNNYFLLTNTGSKNTVYKVMNGMLYADAYQSENDIYPVIYLRKDIKIKEGYGTLESPLVVGEQ